MRLLFHKILSEGRSVRYEPDTEVLHLNVIVTEAEVRRSRANQRP